MYQYHIELSIPLGWKEIFYLHLLEPIPGTAFDDHKEISQMRILVFFVLLMVHLTRG